MNDIRSAIDRNRKKNWQHVAAALLVALVVLGGFYALTLHATPREDVATEEEVPLPPATPSPFESVTVSARAAVVYDLATGETLYEKNSYMQLPLASLTKLLTIYAASEVLGSDSEITISEQALATEGESGFYLGEVFTFEELAKLALVASSNDAAQALAETAARLRAVEDRSLLAGVAHSLSLAQTYAVNGTGLDESLNNSGGYGTAADMARLAGALLAREPDIARASTRRSVTTVSESGFTHTMKNTNQEVGRYPNLLLSKTGFTDLAGGNLVIVFDAGIGHPVAIVALGSTLDGRFRDVERLTNATLKHFSHTNR